MTDTFTADIQISHTSGAGPVSLLCLREDEAGAMECMDGECGEELSSLAKVNV